MRPRISTLLLAIVIPCVFFSCKKKPYNPSDYDSFLYKYTPPPAPPTSYEVSATVDGVAKKTSTGTATVSGNGDTLTIKGVFGTSILQVKIFHFDDANTNVFLVGGSNTSLATYDTNGTRYDASLLGGGQIIRKNLDTKYHQIEGNFNFVLYNSNGDSLKISNGYFKINYSPYFAYWDESYVSFVADSFSAVGLGTNQYTIVLYDTKSKTGIKMILPTTASGSAATMYLGQESGGFPKAYYIDNKGKLNDATGGEGDFSTPLLSGSGIVYGSFGTSYAVHDPNFAFSFSGGSYSVQLEK
jgi:hypothetical protein